MSLRLTFIVEHRSTFVYFSFSALLGKPVATLYLLDSMYLYYERRACDMRQNISGTVLNVLNRDKVKLRKCVYLN